MKKYFIYSVLLLLVNSCNTDKASTPERRELKSDKKLLEEIISPDFLTRVNDNLIISSSNSKSDTMLYIYSLPDLKYVAGAVKKGSGPGEMRLFPMFCESSNQALYVWGYGPQTIKKFDINKKGELKFLDLIKLPRYESFNNMHILNDSLFIYYLPDNLEIVKVDLKSNKCLDEIQMEKDAHNESFFYSNRGTIAVNDSFLVFAYLFKKQINIYRVNDFKLEKEIIGDYEHREPVAGDSDTPVYYTQIIAGERFLYALCKENKSNGVFMEVYNFDGLIVREFTFDITPNLFAVDENNKTIYGYGYDDRFEPYLLKFKY
ncbi:BF3164 family lipoprotein [Maribellus maritimus]|uniref:BF3164 family lipoprotein n=1 Tax=Maribellus maritimus TaxID=2870838 RepID=UPI001EEA1DD2|nr:BF3164 family lipoprotein [Maribellus maritimus]MCG6191055.1 TolB-like 6-bladed beta-propeller domain-containing protein [Maribellus maritimus]